MQPKVQRVPATLPGRRGRSILGVVSCRAGRVDEMALVLKDFGLLDVT